jgi:hypothetical protein
VNQPPAKVKGYFLGSEDIMQSSIDVFQDVVRYLDHHEESLRIKKLIFCICKKYWENDPNILNSISLDDLINELVQTKTNNEQLTFSVYKLVKTLNRPKVYAGVATIIIDQIGKLYNTIASHYDTQLIPAVVESREMPVEESSSYADSLLEQITRSLSKHTESTRIKKLLFATCKHRWENDPVAIDRYGLQKIILEIQQKYPSSASFKQGLHKIVENINKKALYVAVSDIILLHFESLYDTEVDYEEYEAQANTREMKTQIVPLKNHFMPPRAIRVPEANEESFGTSIVDFEESRAITELHIAEPASPSYPVERKQYDPFELRLELFQYTNPLRVKILLYSILFNPWEQVGPDWITLRHYTLEEMLEQVIQSGKSLQNIEEKLEQIARSGLDREENSQAVSSLIQALQRIF